MSDWKCYQLKNLGVIKTGKTPPSSCKDAFSNTGVPFVTPKDMNGVKTIFKTERYLSKIGLDSVKNYLVPKNSIAVSCIGSDMGKAYLLSEDSVTNQQINTLIVNNNHNFEFIYYKLSIMQDYLKSIAGGSATPILNKSHFSEIEIELPDLDTQNNFVEKLKYLDKKIQLNTQINKTLEQIAQALFKSWFVDFDPVRTKVQALSDGLSLEQAELAAMQAISGKTAEELTALSQTQPDRYAKLVETAKAFPCEMVEVDGVEVPKGWEVKELGSLMTIKRGGSPRPIKDFISDKGLNWVKISDATAEDNPFLFSTKEYIKSEGLSKTVLLNKGSLILSNSATPGLPRFLELDACIHDGWLYFSDIKRLTQEYLYFFFLNIRNDLVAQGNGSVFTNLKTDIVKAQKAIVPDERVICYFDKQVKSIMNLIRYNTANSISLKETRDLLLPRLLNGEI